MDNAPLPAPADGLTAQTLRGAKWAYLSSFINAGLQIGVTAVLARALAPSAFGLVAMAGLVLRFGQYFAQMGVGQAIVQRPVLRQEHVPAGLWASVILGAAFSALAWVGAPFAAAAFNSEALTAVLRAMGMTFLIGGTSTTARALLRRGMRFRALAIADTSAYVIGYAGVGVLMALSGYGVWSLVAAALCQALISSIVCNVFARPRAVPVLAWRPYAEILGFGSTVSIISFLEFLNSSLDTIVVGRLSGAASLGYYSRALSLTGLPMQYMSTSLSSVLFPSFSRVQAETTRLRNGYLSVITIFAGVGLPIAFGMSAAAQEIVAVLLGPRWGASIPVMRLVAVASAASMLSHFGGVILEATAQLKEKLVMRTIQLIVFASLLVGLSRFGLLGYALAFTISEVLLHFVLAIRVGTLFHISVGDNLGAHLPGMLCGVLVWVILYGESVLGARLAVPSGATLLVQVLTGVCLLGSVGLRLGDGRVFCAVHERMGVPSGSRIVTTIVRILARMSGNAVPAPSGTRSNTEDSTGR